MPLAPEPGDYAYPPMASLGAALATYVPKVMEAGSRRRAEDSGSDVAVEWRSVGGKVRASLGGAPACAACGDRGYLRPTADGPAFCDCPRGGRERERERMAREDIRRERRAGFASQLERTLRFGAETTGWTWTSSPIRNTTVWKRARAFFKTWDGKQNLVLHGRVGAGKTGLLVAGLRELMPRAVDELRAMYFFTVPEFFAWLHQGFNDDKYPYERRLNNLKSCWVLALDDLGKERRTDWNKAELFDVVNARHRDGLPIFLTTNLDRESLEAEWLDEAVASRLFQHCRIVECDGADLRDPVRSTHQGEEA